MSSWDPIRDEFFRRTVATDFKTIYQRQLDIAERGIYKVGSKLRTEHRSAGMVEQRTGTLRRHLAAAPFDISTGGTLTLETQYPLYIRFLDMKRKGNHAIYNRQIWGVLFNETLFKLEGAMYQSTWEEIRSQLEGLFPQEAGG